MSPYAPGAILLFGFSVLIAFCFLMSWIARVIFRMTTGQRPEVIIQAGRRSRAEWVEKKQRRSGRGDIDDAGVPTTGRVPG